MKRIHWILVGWVLGAVLFTALPRVDAPDTAFNETDAPALVSFPASPRLRLISPVVPGINLSKAPALALVADVNHRVPKFTSALRPGCSNLQPLLCTFLI